MVENGLVYPGLLWITLYISNMILNALNHVILNLPPFSNQSNSTQYRAPICMGAVGAIPPPVFESVGASTHGFLKNYVKNPSIFKRKIL